VTLLRRIFRRLRRNPRRPEKRGQALGPKGKAAAGLRTDMTGPTNSEAIQQVAEVFDELRAAGKSSEDIFVILYSDLKQLARRKVSRQPPGASMHATRLLSDLYMRLFGKKSPEFQWESASHFFNTMALAMEQLLIDHARHFKSCAHGGSQTDSLDALAEDGFQPAGGPTSAPSGKNLLQENVEQAVVVKELLDRLEHDNDEEGKGQISRRQAGIVRLRVFVGLTEEEAAEVLGCSSETVTKEFRKAKAKMASYARRERTRPEAGMGQNYPA
jgi:DNA-directed RNA polymerase specialized sigma24 family protein